MNAKALEQIKAADEKAKKIPEMRKLTQFSMETPYVYDYFNIRCFPSKPASTNASIPARLVNCLIKATNEIEKLPRIIVVIPDWNILNTSTIPHMELWRSPTKLSSGLSEICKGP